MSARSLSVLASVLVAFADPVPGATSCDRWFAPLALASEEEESRIRLQLLHCLADEEHFLATGQPVLPILDDKRRYTVTLGQPVTLELVTVDPQPEKAAFEAVRNGTKKPKDRAKSTLSAGLASTAYRSAASGTSNCTYWSTSRLGGTGDPRRMEIQNYYASIIGNSVLGTTVPGSKGDDLRLDPLTVTFLIDPNTPIRSSEFLKAIEAAQVYVDLGLKEPFVPGAVYADQDITSLLGQAVIPKDLGVTHGVFESDYLPFTADQGDGVTTGPLYNLMFFPIDLATPQVKQ